MKKFFKLFLSLLLAGSLLAACEENDIHVTAENSLKWNQTSVTAKPGKTIELGWQSTTPMFHPELLDMPEGWTAEFDTERNVVRLTPSEGAYGRHTLRLQTLDANGQVYQAFLPVEMMVRNAAEGVYVLNENSWAPGSLIYIDPEEELFDNVYRNVNGEELPATPQDLFIHDGRLYIIAQDGGLVIAEAATMRKLFDKHFYDLQQPSHIAVLDDENIFIRDGKGIYRYDKTADRLTFVEGSDYASKAPMIVLAGRVYAHSGSLMLLEKGQDKVNLKSEIQYVSGVDKAPDGKLFVTTSRGFFGEGPQTSFVHKVDPLTLRSLESHEIKEFNWEHNMEASRSLAVFGNKIYYSGTRTVIWCHDFASNQTRQLIDLSKCDWAFPQGITYNTVAVHPLTGRLYMNRLSGFGEAYKTNKILVMEDKGEHIELIRSYDDYTAFPAGIFFPAQFE